MSKTLILIPSRLSATRLPGKPLLKINNLSIISHVLKKAKQTKIGEVYVAAEDQEIVDDVKKNGGQGILTSNHHKTGTDRIFECFKKINIKDVEYIINLQGDEPNIDIDDIIKLNNLVIKNKAQIGTLGAKINHNSIINNANIVKVITKEKITNKNFPEAFNFIRTLTKEKEKYIYHHIGIYAYQSEILKKIVNLNQSNNEIKNNLEQLRALDNGFKINVALAKVSPISIDTMEDYIDLKKKLEYKT